MKLMVIPKSKAELVSLLPLADAFVLGVSDLCVNLPTSFNLAEIEDLIKIIQQESKEVFIYLNKNMHNHDLILLKETMLALEPLKINGIFYYDIAIVNLKLENHLLTPLVWAQEHMATNYVTSNYWARFGADYTLLAGEITLEEVKEIKENAVSKLILPIFGYLPMFVSKRHLVKNYLDTFNLKDHSKLNYLEKEGQQYPIIDSNDGTVVYAGHILNGISEVLNLDQIKLDYLLLNSFKIDDELFKEVVMMFKSVNSSNIKEYSSKIDQMFKTDRGFLYKETIFKVKK